MPFSSGGVPRRPATQCFDSYLIHIEMHSAAASPGSSSDLYAESDPDGSLGEQKLHTIPGSEAGDGRRQRESVESCESLDRPQEMMVEDKNGTPPSATTIPGMEQPRQEKRKHETIEDFVGSCDEDLEDSATSAHVSPILSESSLNRQEPEQKRLRLDLSTNKGIPTASFIEVSETVPRRHGLPISIWQKIFCLVPPVFLGRLLRVNRQFNTILTSTVSSAISQDDQGQQTAEEIWTASRKKFAPGLPRTLPGLTELDMWRLLRGGTCQLCGEKKVLLTAGSVSDPWRPASVENGVRVIWPFGVRSCGNCLKSHSEQVGIV